MKFDEEKVKEQFPEFWKKNYSNFQFFLKGSIVEPQSIKGYRNITLREGDFESAYTYEVKLYDLSVMINNHERPMSGICYIKVVPFVSGNNEIPGEKIEVIKNNRIDLYER